jgi:two-component system, cell cycle response regulator DivK
MKILYVEDNDDNIFVLHRRVTRWGYTLVVARDGREGVDMAMAERPDVIVMDVSMPRLDGLEATRILKSSVDTKNIPIVALTAHAMVADEERALAAGCDDFVAKPVNFDELRAKIDALAQRPKPA